MALIECTVNFQVTEESIESSQRDSLISPSLSMGPSPSFDQFGGPSPSFDQFGGPSPSFEQFGGPSTSSFSSQQSSFGLPGSPHPLSNQQYSDASSVASQPSLFPEDYSPYQQESYSSHSYSPQPAMFPSESSNYQDIHYSSSGLQGQEDYLSLQQYPSSAEDPLGETGAYGLMPQQAGPSHLLNKKNEPRQRQPKKSRHSCTPQEYEEYQREQVNKTGIGTTLFLIN